MGKNKPRHNPDKPQNRYGSICSYYEGDLNGHMWCERGEDVSICKGNPHNCIKVFLHKLASKSDEQKEFDGLSRKKY